MNRHERDERNRKVCDLRLKGLTPAQICRRLKLSRGVVNGVLWREGLSVQVKAVITSKRAKAKPPKVVDIKQEKARAAKVALEEAKAIAIEPIPLGTDSGCQWIHGDPQDRVMCGHTPRARSVWCAHHYDRVYQRLD